MMAVCEVLLPISVAKPSTRCRLSCAVSEGREIVRDAGCAACRSRKDRARVCPCRLRITRRVTSWISSARSRRYGSLISLSVFAYLPGDLGEDVLHVVLVLLQGAQHFVDERAVFHHQQVRVEDAGIVRADGDGDALLHLQDLLAGGEQRRLEALDLGAGCPTPRCAPAAARRPPADAQRPCRARCPARRRSP